MILAILKVIPILDKWFQEIQKEYIKRQILSENKEFLDALKTSVHAHDVTKLRDSIGRHLTD
jgi:hypothetical protein